MHNAAPTPLLLPPPPDSDCPRPDYLPIRLTNLETGKVFELLAFLDSGANGDVIDPGLAAKLGCEIVSVPGTVSTFHSGIPPMPRKGIKNLLKLNYGKQAILIQPDSSPLLDDNYIILGRLTRQQLGICPGPFETDFPPNEDAESEPYIDLTVRNQRVFDPLQLTPAEEAERAAMRLEIEDLLFEHTQTVPIDSTIIAPEAIYRVLHLPNTPAAYIRQYPTKEYLKTYVQDQLTLWLQNKKIRHWNPEVDGDRPKDNLPLSVAVTKFPDGSISKVRVVMDAREINKGMIDEPHPLPVIPLLYSHMAGNKFHSSLDATACFLQFPVLQSDQRKLAFTWNGTVFVFTCLIFGLKNASQFVQRVLSQLFADFSSFLQIYVDDLIISSNTLEQHRLHLIAVIERCNDINFLLSPSKSKLFMTQLKTLGNQVSGTTVSPDPEKIKTIMSMPAPTTREQLISLLSLANYNRTFVRAFAMITAPLNELRSPSKPFVWTERAHSAFLELQHAMAHSPAQHFPDFTKPFAVIGDSSIVGVGAALFQPTFDGETVTEANLVAFVSRSLKSYERRWSVYRLELAAILYALRSFEDILSGRHFILYTDCMALTYLNTQANKNRILEGWHSILNEFDFTVRHIPGHLNVLADSLSRIWPNTWGIPTPTPAPQPDAAATVTAPLVVSTLRRADRSSSPSAPQADSQALDASPSRALRSPSPSVRVLTWHEDVVDTWFDSFDPATVVHDEPSEKEIQAGKFRKPISPEHALILVQDAHDHGHFGTRSVTDALKASNYSWPGMGKLVKQVCSDCRVCQNWTRSRHGYHPLRSPAAVSPWKQIQIDLITSFEPCSDGSRYVLIIIDCFTSFVLLYSLPEKSAHHVAKALWHAFGIFGPPQVIQSDNDKAFLNAVVADIISSHGSQHRLIEAYTPRINGKVERAVGSISSLLRKLMQQTGQEWTKLLPMTQLMFNTKIKNLTGATPFSLIFNRPLNAFTSYVHVDPTVFDEADFAAWAERERYLHDQVFPVVRERAAQVKSKQDELFDLRHLLVKKTLPTGAIVMLFDHTRSNKSDPVYLGPYTIARITHSGLYTLRDEAGGIYPSDVPRDHLKPLDGASVHLLDDSSTFYVDRIIGHRTKHGSTEYLVLWVGYDEPTWEPQANINDQTLIRSYFANLAVIPHRRSDAPVAGAPVGGRSRSASVPANFSDLPPPRSVDSYPALAAATAAQAAQAYVPPVLPVAVPATTRSKSKAAKPVVAAPPPLPFVPPVLPVFNSSGKEVRSRAPSKHAAFPR